MGLLQSCPPHSDAVGVHLAPMCWKEIFPCLKEIIVGIIPCLILLGQLYNTSWEEVGEL